MLNMKIALRADRADVCMETYIIEQPLGEDEKTVYPTVVICPGGGYAHCSRREAEPIALNFNAAGFNAVVVNYSVAEPFPAALVDLSNAVALVRSHAKQWHVDVNKIIICGFSAGGHLAASLGAFWSRDPAIYRADGLNKPNGMILSYPVITSGEHRHEGSFQILAGDDPAMREYVSIEKQVNADFPPTFLWHTFEDGGVPVENSICLLSALAREKISTEAHIFPKGSHGLSLSNEYVCADGGVKKVQSWIGWAIQWIKEL